MRLALLIGADPKSCSSGAVVRFLRGKWTLVFEGLKDSTFTLNFEGRHFLIPHNKEFEIETPEFGSVSIGHRGCEESVSIFAQRIEG